MLALLATITHLLRTRIYFVLYDTFTATLILERVLVLGLLHIFLSKGSMDRFFRSAYEVCYFRAGLLQNFTYCFALQVSVLFAYIDISLVDVAILVSRALVTGGGEKVSMVIFWWFAAFCLFILNKSIILFGLAVLIQWTEYNNCLVLQLEP